MIGLQVSKVKEKAFLGDPENKLLEWPENTLLVCPESTLPVCPEPPLRRRVGSCYPSTNNFENRGEGPS